MSVTTLAGSKTFPEVLGEMPIWSDQMAISSSNKFASSQRFFRVEDQDDLAKQVLPSEQNLWRTLGNWDL